MICPLKLEINLELEQLHIPCQSFSIVMLNLITEAVLS